MNKAVRHLYEFGPFVLDPGERLLRHGAARMELPPRAFDTLLVLVENNGRLLEKDALMRTVWRDTVVEENNLSQVIYLLRKALRDGEEVVVVAPSAKLSGTVRSAEVAAQEFPGLRVHVVDTQTVAGDLGTLVLLAHQWAGQGLEAEEIVRRLQACSRRSRTYFMVATLEYLQKGGRIGGARALLGELLQVKPILCVREGQVEAYEQQRTKRRAVARLMELAREQAARGPEGHLCVMHAEAISDATMLVRELKGALDLSEVPIYEMPPAIVVHGGPGILAVGFFVPETPMV